MAKTTKSRAPSATQQTKIVVALARIGNLLAELRGTLPAKAKDECDAAIAAIDDAQ